MTDQTPAAPDTGLAQGSLVVLRKRADFVRASNALRTNTASFGLQGRRRGPDEPGGLRVGFTCSKKVGNAVARNRAKRRLREIARAILPVQGRPGWDYVLIGRPGTTATHDFRAMQADLLAALARLHKSEGRPAADRHARRDGPAQAAASPAPGLT
jgi:ribonuclease P protein component